MKSRNKIEENFKGKQTSSIPFFLASALKTSVSSRGTSGTTSPACIWERKSIILTTKLEEKWETLQRKLLFHEQFYVNIYIADIETLTSTWQESVDMLSSIIYTLVARKSKTVSLLCLHIL